ncbi:AAA family ATPase [Nocardioides terrisoli]|uniref:AAA family ATPase n=1 Tax=Nocardioides terrisoli TaxID=3388267 RepID=UPI00287B6557|nr:AAA family ATPase [Nocardioides marmorisolisilvae]
MPSPSNKRRKPARSTRAQSSGNVVRWPGLERDKPDRRTLKHAVSLTSYESKQVRWVWEGRIPLGKITIIDGDPNMGKSVIANADLASRVTTGSAMPDGGDGLGEPRSVVLVVAEDDIGDTVRPRLEAAGADLDYMFTMPVQRNDAGQVIPLTIPDDLERLREVIEEVDAALVVIDPITAFLSESINSHNDASVRRALSPLKEVAEETGAAVLLVRHLNKSGDAKAIYRGGGSIAFSGAARSALVVERLPSDPEWSALAQVKGNLSRKSLTIKYRVVSAGPEGKVAAIEWGETCELSADDLLSKPDARKNAPARTEAKAFLMDVLADGPLLVAVVQKHATAAGISWTTVKRASTELGVVKETSRKATGKRQIEGWVWSLPKGLKSATEN